MTYESFMEEYLSPFDVDGVSLENVDSIHGLYRTKMLECNSLGEMKQVREKFRFLCSGSKVGVMNLGSTVDRIKELFSVDAKLHPDENDQLPHIILPLVMLNAHVISKSFGIPEYPAAVQYVASCLKADD